MPNLISVGHELGLQRIATRSSVPAVPASLPILPSSGAVRQQQRRARLVGLITNARSHRNKVASGTRLRRTDVIDHAPNSHSELREALELFARRGIDTLAIDGGDGTVRDVLTCAGDLWTSAWPDILLLPSGKTNALALDVGVPVGWSLDQALAATESGQAVWRSPIEVRCTAGNQFKARGFLLGAGAFVDATALAQRTHRAGAFNGVAVGLALGWTIAQTLFGRADTAWRAGRRMGIEFGDDAVRMHACAPDGAAARYLLLVSTLCRLPLGLKPFGDPRSGLKALIVDAPPRQLAAMIGPLLAGWEGRGLERRGYHRVDASHLSVDMETGFVLDGEAFPPEAYQIRQAQALRFLVA